MKNWIVYCLFLVIRLSSVYLVQTYFVADEYWQSLEVAHRIVFGYGYLTWEWVAGIRSYFYPLIFAGIFKALELVKLDDPQVLIYAPRVWQAILSASADLSLYQWSGSQKWAAFSIVSSWFWFYTASRTLINTFESAITTIALSQFPWINNGKEESCQFLWLAALICAIRPTAAIIWIPICFYHLTITRQNPFKLILMHYVPIGSAVFLFSVIIDSWTHGSVVVTSYEFLKFNVVKDVGSWYGSQPWFWYLSAGFPAILGIQFIPFVMAVLVILRNRFNHPNELALLGTIVFVLATYSYLPHKEFRFLLPLLPIVLYVSARFLSAWSRKTNRLTLCLTAVIILLGNLGPIWYLSLVHQRGSLDVMKPLREIAWKNPHNTSFLFLMPCHSTPYYSHLHINVSARFLSCEPNFYNSSGYVDEADQFYKEPMGWLRKNYPPNGQLPSHIICFDSLLPRIGDILTRYKTVFKVFHTNIPSSRIGEFIVVNERIEF